VVRSRNGVAMWGSPRGQMDKTARDCRTPWEINTAP
jgi:hypothetical protein